MRCLHFSFVDQEHLSARHVAVLEPFFFFGFGFSGISTTGNGASTVIILISRLDEECSLPFFFLERTFMALCKYYRIVMKLGVASDLAS